MGSCATIISMTATSAPLLPPGPRLPRTLQTLGFAFGGWRWLVWCRRRYGGAVTLHTLFDDRFVMVFEPALVRQLFQGPHEQLNAGEANRLLGPILGERSVLLLDGSEHLRHRRLMLPAFHGARMAAWETTVVEAADAEIDRWPVGREFPLLPSLQALTLRVIVRAVFGYEPGAAERELRARLRAMVEPVAQPRGLLSLFLLPRLGLDQARRRFEAARAAVDELLYAEIERRRADPALGEREDVFSALLAARDASGERLSPREVRDELVTLLLAGHETTATGLAWTLDLLLHAPEVLKRAREGDLRYLDAVVREGLRLRPVIPGVGRVVRGAPFRLGEWEIPAGIEINPSIRLIHRRADLYPEPHRFRPERFLGADAPDTYTWLPFGGGTRRCLGASFAQMEMRLVLRRILARAQLRAVSPRPERAQFRAITLAPRRGVRVLLEAPPAPAPPARAAVPAPAPAPPARAAVPAPAPAPPARAGG
jgi:cytochrome P450